MGNKKWRPSESTEKRRQNTMQNLLAKMGIEKKPSTGKTL